jgi:hypothetical protein
MQTYLMVQQLNQIQPALPNPTTKPPNDIANQATMQPCN